MHEAEQVVVRGPMGPTKALKPVSEDSERYLHVNEAAMQKLFPTEEERLFIEKAATSVAAVFARVDRRPHATKAGGTVTSRFAVRLVSHFNFAEAEDTVFG